MALKTSFTIDLLGNLQSKAKQFQTGLHNLGAGGSKSMGALQQSFARAGSTLNALSQKYMGAMSSIGMGIGGVAIMKDAMELDGALKKIRRTGGYTKDEIAGLKGQIIGLLGTPTPLNHGEWMDVASAMHHTGIKVGEIRTQLQGVGRAAAAAQVAPKAYAEAYADLHTKYKVAAADMPALQESLNKAMKYEDVSKSPEEFLESLRGMTANMQAFNAQGLGNAQAILALQSALTSYKGSASGAAEATGGLLNGILRLTKDKKKMAALKSEGINFFNADGTKKNVEQLLPVIKQIGDFAAKQNMSDEELGIKLFGKPEAGKAVVEILKNYEKIMTRIAELKVAKDLDADFQIATTGISSKLKTLRNQLTGIMLPNMEGPLNLLSSTLSKLQAHPLVAKGLVYSIIGTGGLLMLTKVVTGFGSLATLLKGASAGRGVLGKAGAALGAGAPVYVTNMPGSGIRGSGGATPPGAGGAASTAGKLAKYGSGLAGLAGGLALPIAGVVAPLALGITEAAKGRHWGNAEAGDTGVAHLTNTLPFRKETSERYESGTKWMLDIFSKMGGIKANPQKTEVGGKIKIEIDDKRTTVQSVQTSNKNVPIDVNTGIWGTGTVN